MKLRGKRRARPAARPDAKKESLFKLLSSLLSQHGYQVRREELRRGAGFRVVSGACRAHGTPMVFVDRFLSQDDQLTFLASKIAEFGVEVPEEQLLQLPDPVQRLINRGERAPAAMTSSPEPQVEAATV